MQLQIDFNYQFPVKLFQPIISLNDRSEPVNYIAGCEHVFVDS